MLFVNNIIDEQSGMEKRNKTEKTSNYRTYGGCVVFFMDLLIKEKIVFFFYKGKETKKFLLN